MNQITAQKRSWAVLADEAAQFRIRDSPSWGTLYGTVHQGIPPRAFEDINDGTWRGFCLRGRGSLGHRFACEYLPTNSVAGLSIGEPHDCPRGRDVVRPLS